MTESEIIENPFQSPCSTADLVNNQSTPCTISSFSTYSSVNSENKSLSVDLTFEAAEFNVIQTTQSQRNCFEELMN